MGLAKEGSSSFYHRPQKCKIKLGFISSPLMGSLAKGFFLEILRRVRENLSKFSFYYVRKGGFGNSAESLRKFRGNVAEKFLQGPLPERPHKRIVEFSYFLPGYNCINNS